MALIVGGTTVTGTQKLDASKLTGNLPAISGASLTNLPSSAPSTAQVGTATAGIALNAVGSYAMMFRAGQQNYGSTTAGSNLRWSNGDGNVTGSAYGSGTWRTMGHCRYDATQAEASSVFLRIS